MRRFGHGYVTIVTDYNDGLQYVIDVDQGNCTVEPISRRRSTYAFSGPWDPASVHTPDSPGLFDLSAFNLTFIAEYKVETRDIMSDVWIGSRVDWPSPGVNSTVKVFYNSVCVVFLPRHFWTTEGSDIAEFKLQMKLNNAQLIQSNRQRLLRLEYHTTNEARPNNTCYDVLLRHDPRLFEAALRKFIVGVCGITPIRVNSIETIESVPGDIHQSTRLSRVIAGNVYSSSSVSLEDAVRRLGLVVDQQTDFGITVNYPEGATTIRLIPGSLRTYGKLASSYKTGHATGKFTGGRGQFNGDKGQAPRSASEISSVVADDSSVVAKVSFSLLYPKQIGRWTN
ncbi:hypothetical protein NP493_1696g00000 [Ridgeia piscesae]|uniref:LolA-like domain-containing protein n=1 Tax=Ridgeia piscesae TaxID=27915 RepID=A0AAD9JV06_RIDPI|nr:hypothetical protein NP493_1696g00000 [Ridgeia piscesae]